MSTIEGKDSKVNAETFFKHLDKIRSEARAAFGMKLTHVTFLSAPVQDLIKLVDAIHDEGIKKTVTTEVTGSNPPSPPTVDHLKGLEPVVEAPSSPDGPMTHEALPRDPKPVHPIEVVEATESTVVAPVGGWQDGDS